MKTISHIILSSGHHIHLVVKSFREYIIDYHSNSHLSASLNLLVFGVFDAYTIIHIHAFCRAFLRALQILDTEKIY